MKNNKFLILLLAIILLGGMLRFWKLDQYPVSLSIDEVAVGYNAYSILETARDEYGSFLPLVFRSVGDYKPPVLIYLMTPAIAIFGLNEFGIRFTVALIGAFTLLVVFLLIKQITKNKSLGMLTAFFLAISPWHIFFSRASFEAIVALFFVLLGAWLFHRALELKGKFLWLSGIFFVISIYSYHAERIFVPLLVLGMILIYRKELLRYKTASVKMLIISFLLLLPLLIMMLGPEGQTRAKMTFIAQDEQIAYQLHQSGETLSMTGKILDNNFIILGNFWIKRYLNYWDPSFLFLKGMKFSQPGAPDSGIFYFFELPLFLIGLWLLIFGKIIKNKKAKKLFILWLLIGPLAASLANNDQHALRSLTTIPMPQLIVAFGSVFLLNFVIKLKQRIKFFLFSLGFVIIILNIIYVGDLYFIHYPIQFSENWDYGLKEAALFAWNHESEYNEIVIDNIFGTLGPYFVGTPHLYMLVYGKYNPKILQKEKSKDLENFYKFNFRTIYWPEDRFKENTLFIGSPWRLPLNDIDESQILKRIYFKNGQLGWLIVKT